MRECPDAGVRDLLPDLLHEQLAGDERRRVVVHVEGCVDCSAELMLLVRFRESHARAGVDVARIVAALPTPNANRPLMPVARPAASRTLLGGWRAAAAIVAISLGAVAVGASRVDRGPEGPRESLVATELLPAPAATGLTYGTPLSDISERELQLLLVDLESLETLTPGEPHPIGDELLGGIS